MADTSGATTPTPATSSGASAAPADAGATDSITASYAGFLGAGLVALGLLAFVGTVAVTSSSAPSSLAFAAMSGVALLSLTLVGIMVLTRAVGMTDGTQALGLPQGSVRALLAFALAIVFVSVASWTLGGLFDPMGPEVAKDQGATADVEAFLKPYDNDRYIIVQTQPDPKTSAVSVYLRREAPEKDVVDIAKQIVTISATVLVTIVGFYFGSKSTTDVTKSVNDSLAEVRRTIAVAQNPPDGGGQSAQGGASPNLPGADASTTPATADDIARSASATDALAAATAAKLESLGASPMDILRQAVAEGAGGDPAKEAAAKAALATAETSLATLSDRAKQLAQGAQGADQAAPNLTNAQLQELLNGATQANHEFERAFAAFAVARQQILATTAK